MVCARCGHHEPGRARFCSSCGAPLAADDDETTLTLPAVEAADVEDELERYLEGLPAGRRAARRPARARTPARRTASSGRSPPSAAIPTPTIFLDDITVSRRHVEIDRDDDGYVLRDVGSLNGTYVNRERVDEAPAARTATRSRSVGTG